MRASHRAPHAGRLEEATASTLNVLIAGAGGQVKEGADSNSQFGNRMMQFSFCPLVISHF